MQHVLEPCTTVVDQTKHFLCACILKGVKLQVVPSEDIGEGADEEDADPSLLQDEVRQAAAERKAKMHRYKQTHC